MVLSSCMLGGSREFGVCEVCGVELVTFKCF